MGKSASKIFVKKLKLILEYKGVSNAKTEQETNISQGYISKLISSEETANPSLKLIESLSNYFGIPITALIDENFYPFNKDEKKGYAYSIVTNHKTKTQELRWEKCRASYILSNQWSFNDLFKLKAAYFSNAISIDNKQYRLILTSYYKQSREKLRELYLVPLDFNLQYKSKLISTEHNPYFQSKLKILHKNIKESINYADEQLIENQVGNAEPVSFESVNTILERM